MNEINKKQILKWLGYGAGAMVVVGVGVSLGLGVGIVRFATRFMDRVDQGEVRLAGKMAEAKEVYMSSKDEVAYELIEGWNFIALPLKPYNFSDAKGLLKDINRKDGQASTVSSWDGDRWQEFSQRDIRQYGDNFAIEPAKAYFVKTHQSSSWTVKGELIKKAEFSGLKLEPGWNSLGLFNERAKASEVIDQINEVEGEVKERATVLDWWTVASNWQLYIKRIYAPDNIQEYGDNFGIKAEKGYMIFVNEPIEFKEDL
jgi:hypothetical protein